MSIVEQIKLDALRSAAEYAAAVSEHQRRYRLERMTAIVDALEDRFESQGVAFLKSLGISAKRRDASLVLRKSGRMFIVAPRDDMSLSVNRAIVQPDPKFPLLTNDLYAQVIRAVVLWAKAIDEGRAREVGT